MTQDSSLDLNALELEQTTEGKLTTQIIQHGGDNSIQIAGSGNVVVIINGRIKQLPNDWPQLKENALKFRDIFVSKLASSSSAELDQLCEPSNYIILRDVVDFSSQTADREIHGVLSQLIVEKVKDDNDDINELIIKEAIYAVMKLNITLIKLIAFRFLFSKVDYLTALDKEELANKLQSIQKYFENIEIKRPMFDYISTVGGGYQIATADLGFSRLLFEKYNHLFIKGISLKEINKWKLSQPAKSAFFIMKDRDSFCLNSKMIARVYDNDFNISEFKNKEDNLIINSIEKNNIKKLCEENRYSLNEVNTFLSEKASNLKELWDQGFDRFSLTSIGKAIGFAYVQDNQIWDFGRNDENK